MTAYNNISSAVAGLLYGLDNDAVISRTAAESISAGLPVFAYKGDESLAFGFKKDVAKIVYSADFIASNSTIVTVNGVASAAQVYSTDHLTTINALINKIKAIAVSAANPYGVEAVLDPADTNNRTILIRTKGVANTSTSATTLGSSQPTTTVTTGSGQVFRGISTFSQQVGGAYEVNREVNILERGSIWAQCNAGPQASGPAYVADTGVLDDSGTALTGVFFDSNSASAGLAITKVNGMVAMTYGNNF